jgi:ABC-type glycerol-3-phosphate transport system permease component
MTAKVRADGLMVSGKSLGRTLSLVLGGVLALTAVAAPVAALVGFFSFVTNWTNYFLPYVLLPESDQFPVQMGLATLLAIVPVLAIFLFSQRFLVVGTLAGATKS